jgi:prepilin-type N-terminal cleavage/methylation domain-containing protein
MTLRSPIERKRRNRRGLTLIEVIVAMLVLTIGLLGLAAGTGYVLRTTEVARIDTNRATALQSAIESLRSVPFDDVVADTRQVGLYDISWTQISGDTNWRLMQVVVEGPGRSPGGGGLQGLSVSVVDTLTYRLVRP